MLKVNKQTTLEGRSVIDNTEVVRFRATIPSSGTTPASFDTYVNDQSTYRQNIKQIRADEDEFRNAVREQEDEVYAEPVTEEAPGNTSTATAATVTTKQD